MVGLALFAAFAAITSVLPYHVAQPPFQLGTTATSLLYLSNLTGFALAPVMGHTSQRLGRRTVVLLGTVAMAVGVVLLLTRTLAPTMGGLVLLNGGFFSGQSAALAYVADHAEATRTPKAAATATYQTYYYLGGAVGPLLAGLLWDRAGWPPAVGAALLLLVLAVACVWMGCVPATPASPSPPHPPPVLPVPRSHGASDQTTRTDRDRIPSAARCTTPAIHEKGVKLCASHTCA